ncbi:hypothetical protein NS263_01760 [Curtobacterium oceanosedimentum]|uniref:Uncharacterized protein n=1 Tax=Curtobacterium oceanosedimentum TaxID=465820 RepID=A0ABR5SAH8_9MICO|nr:hypothetical protein NS263_01760 [Curtobacterium oceanosedimentum]
MRSTQITRLLTLTPLTVRPSQIGASGSSARTSFSAFLIRFDFFGVAVGVGSLAVAVCFGAAEAAPEGTAAVLATMLTAASAMTAKERCLFTRSRVWLRARAQ